MTEEPYTYFDNTENDDLLFAAEGSWRGIAIELQELHYLHGARLLAKDVQFYFEANKDAKEVLIIKGSKFLSVSRRFVEGKDYIKMFMKRYLK